jgi:hypothetical protein
MGPPPESRGFPLHPTRSQDLTYMRRILSVAAVALLAIAPAAQAQRGATNAAMPLEFGVDGGLSFGTGGTNNSVDFALPIPAVRVGFHMNPTWSIEPSLSLYNRSVTGGSSTDYQIGVAALYHFSPSRAANQFYARPFLNFIGDRTKTETSPTTTVTTSSNMTEIGAGFGVKMPWRDRMAWRVEGNLSHLSEKVATGDTRVGVLFGLSYFTR